MARLVHYIPGCKPFNRARELKIRRAIAIAEENKERAAKVAVTAAVGGLIWMGTKNGNEDLAMHTFAATIDNSSVASGAESLEVSYITQSETIEVNDMAEVAELTEILEAEVSDQVVSDEQAPAEEVSEEQSSEDESSEEQSSEEQSSEEQSSEGEYSEGESSEGESSEEQSSDEELITAQAGSSEEEIITITLEEGMMTQSEINGLMKTQIVEKGVTINFYDADEEFILSHGVETGDITLTEEEFIKFCKEIQAEAGNQGLTGKVLVGNAILNRMRRDGASLTAVITAQSQFASIDKIGSIPEETREAARMALAADYTVGTLQAITEIEGLSEEHYSGGAYYFYNPKGCSKTALRDREHVEVAFRFKGHIIYCKWTMQ